MAERLEVIRAAFPTRPAFDTAVSHALLARAQGGATVQTLRLYRPDAVVAFGRQDAASEGFGRAVGQARSMRFDAVLRLAGGRAAVFHQGTIAFARTIPDPEPHARTLARFRETAEIVAAALERLGVDARIGEVPGEYCPGGFSVNARGAKKIAGIGQRIVKGAAHVGGVVVVSEGARVRDVLLPVYRSLTIPWDPGTVGAVEEEATASWEQVGEAILTEFAARFDLVESALDPPTLRYAASHEDDHRVGNGPRGPRGVERTAGRR